MSSVANHELVKSAPILSGPDELREFPDWFRDPQHAAWKEFEGLPTPTRKDQAWRFSNVALLDLAPFKISAPLSEDDRKNVLKYSRGLDHYAARMIFANDQLIERDVISEDLKRRGVIFQPLERATVEHADLFRKYFMSTEARLGSAKFAALHKALVSSGTFLFVPRGLEIKEPIEIFHWLRHDNMSIFPHLLLVTDELAKVTVIEHFRSCDQRAAGFACGVNDLIAGPGAKVTYVCAQNWAENVIALQMNSTTVDHDAEANSMPGLEILADNVRCTHGATSGQIDEDELFYLRTRGIPTKVAQRLLVTGFLDEVIQRLDHPAIAEHLHRLIEEKFAK